jgi:hypothetical protein
MVFLSQYGCNPSTHKHETAGTLITSQVPEELVERFDLSEWTKQPAISLIDNCPEVYQLAYGDEIDQAAFELFKEYARRLAVFSTEELRAAYSEIENRFKFRLQSPRGSYMDWMDKGHLLLRLLFDVPQAAPAASKVFNDLADRAPNSDAAVNYLFPFTEDSDGVIVLATTVLSAGGSGLPSLPSVELEHFAATYPRRLILR